MNRRRTRRGRTVAIVIAVIVGLAFLAPLLWVLITSLSSRGDVYRWRGATHLGDPSDPEESRTTLEWVPVARAPELVRAGKILDTVAATALLLQWAAPL